MAAIADGVDRNQNEAIIGKAYCSMAHCIKQLKVHFKIRFLSIDS